MKRPQHSSPWALFGSHQLILRIVGALLAASFVITALYCHATTGPSVLVTWDATDSSVLSDGNAEHTDRLATAQEDLESDTSAAAAAGVTATATATSDAVLPFSVDLGQPCDSVPSATTLLLLDGAKPKLGGLLLRDGERPSLVWPQWLRDLCPEVAEHFDQFRYFPDFLDAPISTTLYAAHAVCTMGVAAAVARAGGAPLYLA